MMEQGSKEWFAARCGKVTASRIADVMARTKKGWGAARGHYMDKLVAERITGQPMAQKQVMSLDRRLEMEPEARVAYEFYSDNEVTEVGVIDHPVIPNAAASPDGLIGDDGGLEIKCCDTAQHIQMITTGVIDPDYLLQCHFGMACTDRQWWDFVSYDPLMPEEMKLWVKRIPRDNKRIAEIEWEVIAFLTEVEAKVAAVMATMSGKTALEGILEKSIQMAGGSDVIQ
jgi:hypothetical protein